MNAPQKNELDKLLQSLDGIAKVQMPAFFYTRLKARMEREMQISEKVFFLLRPSFLASCMFVLFTFNMITLLNNKKHGGHSHKNAANIESFAKEYNLGSNQLYQ